MRDTRDLDSFVHKWLDNHGWPKDLYDNRPRRVNCVHPLVTLIEKLDAISKRYCRAEMRADSFIRHYEDAARIIMGIGCLPRIEINPAELAKEMYFCRDILNFPAPDDPAFTLTDEKKLASLMESFHKINPMFWGPRLSIEESCSTIRSWLITIQ